LYVATKGKRSGLSGRTTVETQLLSKPTTSK
jgi:hypothetical protein